MLLIAFSAGSVKSQVLIALVFGDKLNTPNIEFGLNVGGNFSTLANHPDAKYKTGLNLGLYFNFKLGDHLYLHPEFQFMNQMGTRGVDNRDLPGNDWDDETLETVREINYLTLVFLPRYKLTNQLFFEAGIRGSFLLSADDIWMVKPEERSELYYKDFIRPDLHNFDVGVDTGLGFKFGKGEGVNLSLRYSYGFLNILRDSSEPAEYNRAFHVQVGIPIGVGKENVREKLN
jgi:hypothetical protein